MQRMTGWLRCGLLVVTLGWFAGVQPAAAQYTVLHTFRGGNNDGNEPSDSLTLSGNTLYGMTTYGGSSDYGTVFKMNTGGSGFSILHNFDLNGDGYYPIGSLTLSGSTLYGMTLQGGSGRCGTVFKMNTDGTGYTILHEFNITSDGGTPNGSLTLSGSTLYGMTSQGGSGHCGAVFKMNTDGTGFSILHNFSGNSDGATPFGSLTLSGSTLYGMTSKGGSVAGAACWGVVFKINTDGTGYAILHRFAGGIGGDGACPADSLTLCGSTLYGMTQNGGITDLGTVFKMNTDGTGYAVLHNFAWDGRGDQPFGSLTFSGSTLYGMATTGANGSRGTVFALSKQTGPAPLITANGATGEVTVNYPEALSINVSMNAGTYAGVPVDWWIVALAGSSWYYMNDSGQWVSFDGNLSHCHPVLQGGLFDLPATQVLNMTGLPIGSYKFWFAVDYPMDGVLNLGGPILYDAVNVTVQNRSTRLIAWGDNRYGQCNVPLEAQNGVSAIAVSTYHNLALKNGRVIAWGNNQFGQCNVPVEAQSGVSAIAGGMWWTSLALKDGKVIAWGDNRYGQCDVPIEAQSGVSAIALADWHCLALKDGKVIAWGYSSACNVPMEAQSGVSAIVANLWSSFALKDGKVIAWGNNNYGQCDVPAEAQSGVSAIAAGKAIHIGVHSLALKNGKVIAWGYNEFGQCDVPVEAQSGVIAIAGGGRHSLALKNGKVIAWGDNEFGQCNVPMEAQSGVIAVAGGGAYSLALYSDN